MSFSEEERLRTAAAFTETCDTLRVDGRARIHMLEKACGLAGIFDYLASEEHAADLFPVFRKAMDRWQTRDENIHAVSAADPDYPPLLREIGHPPAVLFWKGKSIDPLLSGTAVAVVGSRRPTVYGLEITRSLVSAIVRRGVPVVSGGARGIDGESHRAALRAGGVTFAVLGCGVDVAYPPDHRALFERIGETGALISEYLPGRKPARHHFPARNRIISGLCHAVLVTEASRASGTLITAGFAADQGRDVCAVPGSVITGSNRSCHQLIREGAVLVESAEDIPGLPEPPSGLCAPASGNGRMSGDQERPAQCPLDLRFPDASKILLEWLDSAPRGLGELASLSGYGVRKTALILSDLQCVGAVTVHRGLYAHVRKELTF